MSMRNHALDVEVIERVKAFHEEVRQQMEALLPGWRVTKVEEESTTLYDYSLASRDAQSPEYILTQVLIPFRVEMIEDGPRQKFDIINKEYHVITRNTLECEVHLLSDGKLHIMHQVARCPLR